MIGTIIFGAGFLLAVGAVAYLCVPRFPIQRTYTACKRERCRTHVIDHDHHSIIGDGAWAPPTARIRDLPKVRGV